MKAMMAGFALMILISVGAYFSLHEMGFSSADRNAGSAVRLD